MSDIAEASAGGTYEVVSVPGFEGDRLVLHTVPGFEPVAVAALPEGLEGGLELVRQAHLRQATWRACLDKAGAVVSAIGRTHGGDGLLRPQDVPSINRAAGSLLLGSLPEVVGALERRFSCALDPRAVEAIAGVLGEVEVLARDPRTLHGAAYALQASSPGPTTLLRLMDTARLGLPAPFDEAYPATPANDVDDLHFTVGSTVVHVLAGDGDRAHARPVEITVFVTYVRDIVDVEADGSVEFYPATCNVQLDPATWREEDGLLYDDPEVEAAVGTLLRDHGLGAFRVRWSERGMQEPMLAHMDIDTTVATVIWPEAVAADVARAKAAGRIAPRRASA